MCGFSLRGVGLQALKYRYHFVNNIGPDVCRKDAESGALVFLIESVLLAILRGCVCVCVCNNFENFLKEREEVVGCIYTSATTRCVWNYLLMHRREVTE